MKKSLYISAIAFMMAGTAFTSCSDFLDAKDKTNADQDADSYLSMHPKELLMTAYNSIYNFASNVEMTDEGTDLYAPHRGKTASAFDQFTFNASTGEVQNYYVNLYGTINYANGVIEKSSDDTQLAEAKFIRAWCYYLLTQQFGNVPYTTSYIQSSKREYPIEDKAVIFEKSIEDLKAVLPNLPTVDNHAIAGQPTQEAAKALIAKFYLAWGWDVDTSKGDPYTAEGQDSIKNGLFKVNSTEHFALAAQYADEATGLKELTLTSEEKWSPKNETNKEVFWAVQYDRASFTGSESDGGHKLQSEYGNYYGEATATGYKQVGSVHGQTLKSAYLFAEGDARYASTFMTIMYNKVQEKPADEDATKGGYYYYYNNPSATAKIGYQYFPHYVTEDQAEAYFTAHKDQYKYTDKVNNQPKAYIIGAQSTVYTFKTDGSWTKSNTSFNELCQQVGGGVVVKKFDDAATKVAAANDYRDIVIFHASDSYLDAAEAYLMAGDEPKALDRLYTVRKRSIADDSEAKIASFASYSAPYTTTLEIKPIDVILDERARELYAERTRWIDLRRTNQLIRYNKEYNDYFQENSAHNANGEWKTYRPIPDGEIGNNTGMSPEEQNPGY